MKASILVCISLASWCSSDPLPPDHFTPEVPSIDMLNGAFLDNVRSNNAFREDNIKMYEKLLTDFAGLHTPERARALRHDLASWRKDLQKWKKVEEELELWEGQRKLNPGPETDRSALDRLQKLHHQLWGSGLAVAPPPRPVKR